MEEKLAQVLFARFEAVYLALLMGVVRLSCVMANDVLLRKMKGHSIVLKLKHLAFG